VFLWAAPVGLVAFGLSFLLKELPLRDTTRAPDRAQTTAPTAVPAVRDSAQEMERALLTLFGRERRAEVYQGLAETAGVPVSPRACWLLYRVADTAPIQADALATVLGIMRAELDTRLAELLSSGYVLLADDGDGDGEGALVTLTPAGQQAAARLEEAREAGIDRLMTGWEPDRHPELRRLLGHVTRGLIATDRAPGPEPAAGAA
jgi:DNA-binding MarR family transcriptional regulator